MQQVGEQIVVAVPRPLLITRYQEQVGLLELSQHDPAVLPAGHRITQRSGQSAQNGGLQQEGLDVSRLPVEHLLAEIVQDKPVTAAEGSHEAGDVIAATHGQRRHLQAGDPALGAGVQHGNVGFGEPQAHQLIKQHGRFFRRETQVPRADLAQLPAGAKACQRQRRVDPGGDDEMQLRRHTVDEESHAFVNGLLVYGTVIIENDHNGLARRIAAVRHLIDQLRQQGVIGRQLRRVDHLHGGLPQPRIESLDGRDEIGPEAAGIVVVSIQRNPAHRRLAGAEALTEERSLAKPRRSRDEDQLPAKPFLQSFDQPGAAHHLRWHRGHVEFRLQYRIHHSKPTAGIAHCTMGLNQRAERRRIRDPRRGVAVAPRILGASQCTPTPSRNRGVQRGEAPLRSLLFPQDWGTKGAEDEL